MTVFALAVIFSFFISLFVSKRVFKLNLLSPPILMSAIWMMFIAASLILFRDYPWHYLGLIWICIACTAYTTGYVLMKQYLRNKKYPRKEEKTPERHLTATGKRRAKAILMIVLVLAFTYVFLRLQTYGVSIVDISNVEDLAETNNAIAVARYTNGSSSSIILQAFLPFVYLAPLLGGFLISYLRASKEKLLCFVSLLPIILMFSFTNEKAAALQGVVLVVSGFIVGYLNKYGRFPTLKPKHIAVIVAGGVLLLSTLLASMMLRIGSVDPETLNIALQKLANSYALSHMPAFDSIFPSLMQSKELTGGVYTFYGIADTLGIVERQQGVYQDFFTYNDITTNIYTAFRGLILDFGVLGALVVSFITGALTALGVRSLTSRGHSSIAIGFLAGVYTFIFFSFIVSFMSYMSLILTFILFTLISKLIIPGQASE